MFQAAAPWDNDPVVGQPRQPAPSRPPMLGQPQPWIPAGAPPPPQQAPALDINTRENTARTRQQVQQGATNGVNFSDENTLRQQYMQHPAVRAYETIMPAMAAAMQAAPGGAGDLQIVYAFGKAMDPGSVVRGEEQDAAANTGGTADQIRGWVQSIQNGGRLDPEVRARLLNEIRTRASVAGDAYRLVRQNFTQQAQRYGFDPNAVMGANAGLPYQQTEADYLGRPVQNMDGSQGPIPRNQVPTVQVQPQQGGPQRPDQSGQDLVFWDDPRRPDEYAPRDPTAAVAQSGAQAQQLFDRGATLDQMNAFAAQHGLGPWGADMAHAIQYRDHGGRGARILIPPRAPERQIPQGDPDSMGEAAGANIRGATNSATVGLDHPLAAAYNTFAPASMGGNGQSFRENLWRENAYDQANQQSHPWATIAGNLEGAVALPTGAPRSARLAFISAIRSGATRDEAISAARSAVGTRLAGEGALYGGVHGMATGEGDFGDRLKSAGVEAALGAASGYAGRFGPGFRSGNQRPPMLPPLVDPATGRLNQPLESASPAERVAAAQAHGINLPLGAATDRGGAIIEKGLDVMPASAGVMNDARRGTETQTTNALENVAGNFGTARSPFDVGTAAQTGARSWIDRATVAARPGQQSIVGKAYDAIPVSPNTDSVLTNTRATLDRLTSRFQSNPELAALEQNQTLVRYRDALASGGLSWNDLKALRSEIGARIGSERFSDSPSRDDLRGLYGALSEDMRATAASQGPRALQLFERANTLNRDVETRIEQSLVPIVGNDSRQAPERAAAYIQSLATGGRVSSNLNQLAAVRASLVKGGHWDDVSSGLIRLGGQPANSPGRSFDPQTFIRWYSDLPEQARSIMFAGRNGQLRQSLDNFVSVAQRLANTNALRNTSNTTPGRLGAGAVGGLAGAAATGMVHPITALLAAGGMAGTAAANLGIAKLWTNPGFVRWATGYTRSTLGRLGTASAAAIASQRARLGELARSSPDLADAIGNLDHRLFGDDGGGDGNQPQ